jgi:hypothetical protein
MTRAAGGVGLALLWALALTRCGLVPELHFLPDDASDTGTATDAANELESTVGLDAVDDASDASVEAGCPSPMPPGVTACCGSIWCFGDCDAYCADCANICLAHNQPFCCNKAGVMACKQTAAQAVICR